MASMAMTFKQWYKRVDQIVTAALFVGIMDLGDVVDPWGYYPGETADAETYEETAREFANEALRESGWDGDEI